MNINFVYAKFYWILPKWLSHVCINLLSCKLRIIGVFRFSGNNDFIIICTPARYIYFIFSLIFSFFILLNVSFIVSFVYKLNFMFPLALLIVILLSIFWYSWIVYFLCIYILFRYLNNSSPRVFRSKLRFWIFCNFLLSKVFFIIYPFLSSLALINNFKFKNVIFLNYLLTHSILLSEELYHFHYKHHSFHYQNLVYFLNLILYFLPIRYMSFYPFDIRYCNVLILHISNICIDFYLLMCFS